MPNGFRSPVDQAPVVGRAWCARCRKARSTCFCESIRSVRPRAELVFLQHPLESRNSVGTARMAHLGLEGSHLIQGVGFEEDPRVQALLTDRSRESWVLYPGPAAIDVSVPAERGASLPSCDRLRVFVIDGTWSCAKGMLRRSPLLAALPRLSFPVISASEYRFRRQPASFCLSTLEASCELLRYLEPELDLSSLKGVFRAMVDHQTGFTA